MKRISASFIVMVCGLSTFSIANAANISMNIPGTNATTTGANGPGAFVQNFYQFALLIGGILALGVIVYGGVKYMATSGNPSGQSDAKEWIESALIGLLLLAGAYFILNVVNPQLTNLTLPTIQQWNSATGISGTGNTNGSGSGPGGPTGNCAFAICTGTNGASGPTPQ